MKKEIIKTCAAILFTCAVVLSIAGSASAAFMSYTDRSGWESAVSSYEEEVFNDTTLNAGVSVTTDSGYVNTTKEVWWDELVCPAFGQTNTTWQFDTPIIAYGGYWNPGVPSGPGAGIEVEVAINGEWVVVGEIPNNYVNQFWGFVSTEPFSAVRLNNGSNCNGAWTEKYELDNMVYADSIAMNVDIKPSSCPNPFNLKSKGVLPVAILGTEDFDVTTIDPASIKLTLGNGGVSPLRWSYEDVGTPYTGDEECGCNDYNGDGYMDLTLKFRTQEVVSLGLGDYAGEMKPLVVTGNLMEEEGGAPIEGKDCVWILE